MIDQILGIIEKRLSSYIVLSTGGIGLKVLMSKNGIDSLPKTKKNIKVLTHLHVREDILNLYGFYSILERDTFLLLISISGIGPKLALTILSGMKPSKLSSYIIEGDVKALTGIPGVGSKTAKRIIIELKDKFISIDHDSLGIQENLKEQQLFNDSVNALVSLGYKNNNAKEACLQLEKTGELKGELEAVIKKALSLLVL